MNLSDFASVNVLGLPILSLERKEENLPPRFFLHSQNHVIFVRLDRKKTTAHLYDSLGTSAATFCLFFSRRNVKPNHALGGWILQKNYGSETCGLHAILFSLGWMSTLPWDRALVARVQPILESMTRKKEKTFPFPVSGLCKLTL